MTVAEDFTQKYTIVQFYDDIKVGDEFSSNNWPLHVTIIDTFAIDWSVNKIADKLSAKLQNYPVLVHSLAESDRYFGESGQVLVTLLKKTKSLAKLHGDILAELNHGGLILNNPEFAGAGFLPHATVQRNGRLIEGQKIQFNNLCIVDMFPKSDPYNRKILKIISML
jgi:2'-5' RNA ligase